VLLGVAALPCASSLLPSTSGGPIGHMRAPAPRAPLSALRLNAADDNVFEGRIAQFAPRQQLPQVRGQLSKLQSQLADAIADEDYVHAAMLRDDLAELRNKDPAVMAATLREELGRHVERERYAEAAKCRDELLVIRRFLPQYQLAGLWKGNYPNHGDETVRLHYDGDQLCAVKITGDQHVPAGEITFRADLTTAHDSQADWTAARSVAGEDAVGVRVEVLSLSSDGAQEPREVEQFAGEGRIAARGFRHPHYVPGQLFLMDDDVIGFLWLPIGTFVVFSRVPEEDEPAASDASALGSSRTVDVLEASAASPLDRLDEL